MESCNIDLLDNGSNTDRFLNLMISFGFISSFNISIRVTRKSATRLDNIFSNYISSSPGFLIIDTSTILVHLKLLGKCWQRRASLKLRMVIDKDALLKFKNELANKDWNTELSVFADIGSTFFAK